MAKNPTYVPAPEIPEAQRERVAVVMAVLTGAMTVTDGANRLGLSRNHFQTLMHRAQAGMIDGMTPKPAGRPSKSPTEVALLEENERLRREVKRLTERVDMIDRLLGVAGDMLKGRVPISNRAKRTKSQTPTTENSDDEEPERRLEGAATMTALGMRPDEVAATVGKSVATLRRWRARKRRGEKLRHRPGPRQRRHIDAAQVARAATLVRDLRGLVGADSIARSVGISRRRAAAIKRETLTEMERERVAACGRVCVLAPGIVRGFDAMELNANGRRWWALIAADAAVPYRTSAYVTASYDGRSVAEAVERDFAAHGAPLVWRVDRARSHETADVAAVLARHGVLMLHGPPRHPGYYGQLERQNREHRAWLEYTQPNNRDDIDNALPEMLGALKAHWRRRTLGWRTAEEVWLTRPQLPVDRALLRDEVNDRAARIRRRLDGRAQPRDLADRLAIERTLVKYGLLKIKIGERC
jgi:transposase